MIVNATPGYKQIVREVWKPLALLFVWDVIVTVVYYLIPFRAPSLPLTLFGSALALFLGFRSNSAYQRWWEGRGLWGLMINASRNIARQARNYLPEEASEMKRTIVLRQIAYVNALRCQLRRQKPDEEVLRFLSKRDADFALARTNVANGILDGTGRRINIAREKGWLDTIQQTSMESVLIDIANAQGGMERLKNTPPAPAISLLPDLVHAHAVHPDADRPGRDSGLRHPARLDDRGADVPRGAGDRRRSGRSVRQHAARSAADRDVPDGGDRPAPGDRRRCARAAHARQAWCAVVKYELEPATS
jgi:putative membrane protein